MSICILLIKINDKKNQCTNYLERGTKMERDNNKGFSMVELIITVAIMAILTGSLVSAAGYLKYANAKAGAKEVNTKLSELRIDSMSKMNTPYMYLYNIGGATYMKVVSGKDADKATISNGILDTNTTKIGNSQIEVFCDSTKITDGNSVQISMDKSTGAFLSCPNEIKVASIDGRNSYIVKLVKSTGRHYMDE